MAAVSERTMFQFYTIAMLPFVLLALTFALRDVAGATTPTCIGG
ncbi:hypothetical protein [Microbacterium terregens]